MGIVKHFSKSFIKPKYHLQGAENPVYLAPWDLTWLSIHYIQKGLLFPNNSPSFTKTILPRLKDSLSTTLVHFYTLAGRFDSEVDEHNHTTLISINSKKGPGVGFIQAELDASISDILSPTDSPCVVESLFDHNKAVNHDGHILPLMSVQATKLNDGVFLGCSMNHSCADGSSFWYFLNAWSDVFNNIPISRPPIQQRWFLDKSEPLTKLPFTHPNEFITRFESPPVRDRTFHFSVESIALLKKRANTESGSNKISSFQALSALVWRCITRARRAPRHTTTRCNIAANVRGRMKPRLSENYFGNAVQWIQGTTTSGELLDGTLGWVASVLNGAVEANDDGAVRSRVMGWMESPVVYQMGAYYDPDSVVLVSSPRFDMYGPEFGMGRAVGMLNGYGNKFDGKVSSSPGRDEGSVDIHVYLTDGSMAELLKDHEFMAVVSL